MGPIWRIKMLGTLQAESEGATISRFRTRRVGLLLAYLAFYRERTHSREELADLLWPECDADLARRNLRQALSSLRHHIEPPTVPSGAILLTKQSRVSLNPELVTSDVAEFTELVASGSSQKLKTLESAVKLYGGDLLPGYYEDWVQSERWRLEDLFVSAVQALSQICEAEGRVDEAIRYVGLALAKDHLREDLHATLMRLYLASDRPASALQHFRDWKETLAVELGDEPGQEVVELATKALRQNEAPTKTVRKEALDAASDAENPQTEATKPVARLPIQLTRFFGRAAERVHAIEALADLGARLVTLVGPAGAGKTRLSIEVGREMADTRGWNVWFVPLADLTDGAMTLDAVAQAMRLPGNQGSGPTELVRGSLPGSRNLLILDNLEHILEGVTPAIEALLSDVPEVSILTTSRHSLKLEGEREIDLATLPVPSADQIVSGNLHELAAVPSVQLFVDRAQAVVPDFQVTANNAQAIASICVRSDGLPLALEIAAGLSNVFTPSQLNQNLEGRLEVLRSRRRDISSRHRSLRAAIDYSFELLSPELRRFFVGLSVFRGGFTIAAASQVCLQGPEAPASKNKRRLDECLRMVLDLQERSLLRTEEAPEGCPARFRLLESFREYGQELMDEKEEAALRRRHANYFLSLGLGDPKLRTDSLVDGERENRVAALHFFFEQEQVHECVVMLMALDGYTQVGRETIMALSKSPRFDTYEPFDQNILMRLLAGAYRYSSQFDESYRAALQALEIAKKMGDETQIAKGYHSATIAAGYLGLREESMSHANAQLLWAERLGDRLVLEGAYIALGTNNWMIGDLENAKRVLEEGLRFSTETHSGEALWIFFYNLGRIHFDLGNLEESYRYACEGLQLARNRSEEFGISLFLGLFSLYQMKKGNLVAALATSREVLVKRRSFGFLYWVWFAIQIHATILIELGRHREAATLLAASRDTTKLQREIDDRNRAIAIEMVKANLTESAFEQAWAQGLAMSLENAYRMAINIR